MWPARSSSCRASPGAPLSRTSSCGTSSTAPTLTDHYEAAGALPAESPLRVSDPACAATVKALLRTVTPGDYVAFLAYVPMNETHEVLLQAARLAARDTLRVATYVGFGPRYLHSTGQAYKGGPNSGVFIQIISDDPDDLAVPGRQYSFGVVKAAQALGDFRVLQERGRRALRVHLGSDVKAGLALLSRALEACGGLQAGRVGGAGP